MWNFIDLILELIMSNVWAVMMVKDEIDILPFVLDHLIEEELDGFYIADNNSTDGTRDLLSDYSRVVKNFHVIDDPDIAYYQQIKMNKWISNAVDIGADIIVPADADEIWYSKDHSISLASALRSMQCEVAVGYVYDMIPQVTDFNTGNPTVDIVHKDTTKEVWPCVAFKYVDGCNIGQGNHTISHPGNSSDNIIEIRHFQYRSLSQYKRKLRNGKIAYEATDLPNDFGTHWRYGGSLSDEQLEIEWNNYMNKTNIIYSPAPVKQRMEK